MRLREFTNADEQLGLLRRIIDSTWTAIADEAAEQKKQRELERIEASKKPRTTRTRTASSPRRAPPANLVDYGFLVRCDGCCYLAR